MKRGAVRNDSRLRLLYLKCLRLLLRSMMLALRSLRLRPPASSCDRSRPRLRAPLPPLHRKRLRLRSPSWITTAQCSRKAARPPPGWKPISPSKRTRRGPLSSLSRPSLLSLSWRLSLQNSSPWSGSGASFLPSVAHSRWNLWPRGPLILARLTVRTGGAEIERGGG